MHFLDFGVIPLDKVSSGLFKITVRPYLCSRNISIDLFGDLQGVLIFMDDMLVFDETEAIHNERIRKVFKRTRQVNSKFSKMV